MFQFEMIEYNQVLIRNKLLIMYIIETILPLIISALAFCIAWKHNSFTQKAAEDPILVAHITQDVDAPIFLNLGISNVGAGVAKNIKFNAIRPEGQPDIPLLTPIFELDTEYSVLLEGKSLLFPLDVAHHLMDNESGLFTFQVELEYKNIKNKIMKSSYKINVNELEHTRLYAGKSEIVRELAKIAAKIGNNR